MENESTGAIAPHEGREVELVLNGTKPLATVEHDKDPDTYVKAILLGLGGLVAYKVTPSVDCEGGEVIFTLPQNRHLIDEYRWTLSKGVSVYGLKGYHRALGRLFGYSAADIEAYIDAEITCDCTKCTG